MIVKILGAVAKGDSGFSLVITADSLGRNIFEEPSLLFARMEAIRIFLEYAAHKSFIVFQMDVKTAFLHDVRHLQSTSVELNSLGEKLVSGPQRNKSVLRCYRGREYVVSYQFAVPQVPLGGGHSNGD
ncbi:hypothetical protein Tco_0856872 [Tanacetum coccineum]|uniref:Retrovirus-related Pol polyprotein from transposon TNT 1-94 n=1 Tax=Tanacetum coccineum TaxID=301880 RepID=A0ABQ5B4Q6_9ASTR